MQVPFNIAANTPARTNISGRYIAVLSTGVAASISLTLRRGTTIVEEVTTATRGLSLGQEAGFDAIEVTASVACSVQILVSDARITIDTIAGATVNVAALTPLPVTNDRGSPGTPVYVSGITYTDAPATSVVDGAAVAMSAVVAAIVTANTNRKALRITNLDAINPVAIGSTTITWAKRCIVLQPGDTWVEERGANLAWSGICNTGLTASLTAQEVLA